MIHLVSGCKINLGLRVFQSRPDGYHELETIFAPLAWPSDVITVEINDVGKFVLLADVPITGENLLAKTYRLFAEKSGFAPGITARLRKRVPIGAGLGGGSANAAVFALFLNSIAPAPLKENALAELCVAIGADAPFFLLNKTAKAAGKGEILRALPENDKKLWIALVCPPIFIETAKAFAALDAARAGEKKALTNARRGNKNFSPSQAGASYWDLSNDLEAPAFAAYPELAEIKTRLLELGAIGAAMSGSGSSIYGLFLEIEDARMAVATFREHYERVFLTTINAF